MFKPNWCSDVFANEMQNDAAVCMLVFLAECVFVHVSDRLVTCLVVTKKTKHMNENNY